MNPALPLPRRVRTTPAQGLFWRGSVALMALTFLACAHLYTMGDPDLWGHLRFGLDILQAGTLPQADPYSFTAHGAPWINHEWLAEVLFAEGWLAAGAAGIVWLKLALALLTVGIIFRHLRQQSVSPKLSAVVMLPWLVMIPAFSLIRPLHFTLPCFAALLTVLYESSYGRTRPLWLLTPLFALWANLHGGVLAGVALLAIWVGCLALFDRGRFWLALVPALTAAAATLLNPYGYQLLEFLLRTATVHRPEIIEWEPMRATSANGISYLICAAAAVAGLIRSRLPKPLPLMLVFSVVALLPFAAIRHGSLALLAVMVIAGPHMADAVRGFRNDMKPRRLVLPAWAPLAPLGLTAVLFTNVLHKPPVIEVPAAKFPVEAVRVLKASGVKGNLINRFNWGEYILWHLGPGVQVAIDGRRETVYTKPLYEKYLRFQEGKSGWDWMLREHRTDMALVETELVSASLFRRMPDWQEVYRDEMASIFARRGSPAAAAISRAASEHRPSAPPYLFP